MNICTHYSIERQCREESCPMVRRCMSDDFDWCPRMKPCKEMLKSCLGEEVNCNYYSKNERINTYKKLYSDEIVNAIRIEFYEGTKEGQFGDYIIFGDDLKYVKGKEFEREYVKVI